MKQRIRFLSFLLILTLLLPLVPILPATAQTLREEKSAQDKPLTKAVSVSSVSVPAYSGGTSSGWMTYDCGSNFSRGDTGTQSKMQIIKSTTATQFNTYTSSLKSKGYKSLYEKKVAAQSNYNIHGKYLSPDGTHVLYTYFVAAYNEVRIIVDTNKDTLRLYDYKSPGMGNGNGRTEVYMIPVSASEDGFYYDSSYSVYKRDNAGAFLVIKMPDNSLFIMDGGGYLQMSDRDAERIYALLRRITGIPEGQKIHINTWFITHYHDDHVAGLPRFLYKYNTEFELHNVMYNFDVVGYSGDNMQIVGELFPNARYYKQHTGESFKICDVQFDVLYTVEDFYTPNSSNQLITNNTACYKKSDEENNCSSVLRVSFDGKTMMLTGDIYDSDALLMAMYPAKDLHVDILQLPHHAYDSHVTMVQTIAPNISFLHQSENAIRNRKTLYDNNLKWMPYAGTIYYGNTELVGYCAEEGIFLQEPFTESVDWLGWGNKTWELEEANPYVSTPVADPELYYRYTKTNALTTSTKAYAIVDDKLGYPLAFDAVSGKVSNATPAFHSGDSYYFSASQRRLVNWNMYYSTKGSNSNAAVTGSTTYSGGLPVNKGSGDYWGTPSKNTGITLGNGDTFQSVGMYSSWCSFTNQLDSKSQWVWMDALKDGRVLLYRRADSIYYPLYRDSGAVLSGGTTNPTGWGTAKLSKAQINEKLDYFTLRLYAYSGTSDTMLLSWTGHQDYYADAGISKIQLLSLLTADIRVNYSFRNFPGTGEISYDGQKDSTTFEAGTYCFQFTKTFAGSTPGDYPVVIKYKTYTGIELELGSFTVHIRDRSSDPATKSLFIDFNDDAAARKRYQYDSQYAGINLDGASRWQFIEYNYATDSTDTTEGFVDTLSGTAKLYTKSADTVSKTLSIRSYVNGYGHLKYDPKNAEIVQIRFKMENLRSALDYEARFSLWYHKNTGSGDVSASEAKIPLDTNAVFNGEYVTLTAELSDTFRQAGTISGLRPAFFYVIPDDLSQKGCVTIDYLYIGPRDNAPTEEDNSLFFNFDNSTEAQERYSSAEQYNERNFDSDTLLYWSTDETSTTEALSSDCYIDTEKGALILPVAEELAYGNTNGIYGPWVFTTAVPGVRVDRKDATYHALGYEPKAGDVIRIRFKVEGCVLATEKSPQLVVCYDRSIDGVSGRGSYSLVKSYSLQDGVYQTLTFPVDEEFATADSITTLGFRFWHIKSREKGSGTISIDYIYVGQADAQLPLSHTVSFVGEDGAVLYEQAVSTGGSVQYEGAVPTKAWDSDFHYSFAGWVDAEGRPAVLDNVLSDLTFYPDFEATSHSFEEQILTAPTCSHTGLKELCCACGHSYEESIASTDHSPVQIPGTPASCTASGMSEGLACQVCNAVLLAPTELPPTGHSPQPIPGKPATCVNSGLSDGSFCSECGVTLTAQSILPRLGHKYSLYTDLGATHQMQCDRCGVSRTEAHSYHEGLCVCGKKEAPASTENSAWTMYHSLNLAGDISVNLIVSKSLLDGFDLSTVYMESTVDLYEGNKKTGTTTVRIEPTESGSYYYFILEGLTAVQMNDEIRSVLHGSKNGKSYHSPTDTYSIASYAYTQLDRSTSSEALKTLCADLLRYGAMAQIFKSYRTEELADAKMSLEHLVCLSDMESLTFGNTNKVLNDMNAPSVTWAGKALDLDSKVTVKFIFNATAYKGDPTALRLKLSFKDIFGEVQIATLTSPEVYNSSKGWYVFSFDGLLAAELRSVVSARIYEGDKAVSATLQYSADTYGNNKTGTLLQLCKALMAYSDSAKAYFLD